MNQVLKNAKSYLGNDVIILPSTRKNKKFMVIDPKTHKRLIKVDQKKLLIQKQTKG